MRISIVTPGLKHGGSERVICILANEWIKLGHDVRIVIAGSDAECVYHLDEKVDVYRFGGLKGIKGLAHLAFLRELRKAFKSFKSDVVVSFVRDTTVYTGISLLGTRIPMVYSEISDPNIYLKSLKWKFFTHSSARLAKGIVFQTVGAQACYGKLAENKSKVILNPFDASKLPEYVFENRRKEIVTAGRLVSSKRHDLMIDSFANISPEFPDYIFRIYGDGPLKDDLLKKIKQLGLEEKIFVMGSHSDVVQKMSGASMFLFASDYEGLPNALIEALCIGLPTISTDCSPGGARELIKNEHNGLLVECGNVEKMTCAMRLVLSNDELAKKISVNARKVTERTECKYIAEQWIKYIEEICEVSYDKESKQEK